MFMEHLLTVGESACTGHTAVNFLDLSLPGGRGPDDLQAKPLDPIHSSNNRWASGVTRPPSAETTQAPSGPRPPRV